MEVFERLTQISRIYRQEGPWKVVSLLEKSLSWRIRYLYYLYFQTRLQSRCDFDTSKITKITIDPDQVRYTAGINSPIRTVLPIKGEDAVVGTLSGSWDRFKRPIEEISAYRHLRWIYHQGEDHELLSSMTDGYKEQHELSKESKTVPIRDIELPDEPRLAVGRNNEFMRWTGGYNRIAAAQLLGIDRISAYVVIWHPDADRERIAKEFSDDRVK